MTQSAETVTTRLASPARIRARVAGATAASRRVGLVAVAAVLLGLAAQGYFNRRVHTGDAVYLLACAVGLFIAAFPASGEDRLSGVTGRLVQVLLVVCAALVTARVYLDMRAGRDFVVAVALAFLPLVLIGTAFAGSRRMSRPDDEPDLSLDGLWIRTKATSAQHALDILYLVAGCALALVSLAYWLRPGKSNDALVLNSLSVVLLFLALYRLERGRAVAGAREAADAPPRLVEIGALLLIVGVGAVLRLWQLEWIPYGVWFDEGVSGQEALRFLKGMPFTPMGTYTSNNPSPFFYAVTFAFKIMGPTLLALRVVQALIGILTVPAFYVLLRYILGWRTALAGALVMAVGAWHVNFSRYGMCCNNEAPPFEILTLYFLVKGFRTGRATDFAWGGLMMGVGQYTYAGFRLFPFIIIAYVVYAFVLDKERVRKSMVHLVVYGVIAIVSFLPLGAWALQHRQEFFGRTAQTSVFAGKNTPQERMAALTNSLRLHLRMFNIQGDGNGRHGMPGAPQVDWISGAALVIGLGYCLYRWRSPTYMLLLLWLVITMQSGILSLDWEAPQAARAVVAIPAVYAIVSLVLGKTWQALDAAAAALHSPSAKRVGFVAVAAAVTVTLGLVAYLNYDRYFNQQMKNPSAWYAFSTIDTVNARRVAELGATTNRYFLQSQFTPVFSFLVGGETPDRPADHVFFRMFEHIPLREPITKTAVYLLEPWRVTIEPADMLRYYPNAQFIDHKDPWGKTMVYEFQVSPEDIVSLLGLTGQYFQGAEPTGTPTMERRDRYIAFDWSNEPPLPDPFSVAWSGTVFASRAGVHVFDVVTDGQVRMYLDGELLLDTAQNKAQGQADLPRGQHPVYIEFAGGRQTSLHWTPPAGQRQVIPYNALIAIGFPDKGLLGRYYRGEGWQGRPEFVEVDPFVAFRWHPDPFEGQAWSATWTGRIEAPVNGKYVFQLQSNDRSWLIIDGRTWINGARGHSQVQLDLTAGRHDIQVRYANNRGYSEIRFLWQPPNEQHVTEVPNRVLFLK